MSSAGLFSVNKFARLARIAESTIRHYDRIGLLTPVLRGKNNYRYYSIRQVALVNVIRTLQELGMTLTEIKTMIHERTPGYMNDLLGTQIEKINSMIARGISTRELLLTLQGFIQPVLHMNEDDITTRFLPERAIILGGLNDYSKSANEYDALLDFYNGIDARYANVSLNYPVWGILSEERIRRREWRWPDRFFFYNAAGCDIRPAALYAIGYMRCGYAQGDALYERLTDYIDANELEVCGDAYEEYPLNELCISDSSKYLMRVMITVRKKRS